MPRSIATRVLSLARRVCQRGKIAQRVNVVDSEGIPWEALYTLELQPDGSVKISRWVLLKAGQAI